MNALWSCSCYEVKLCKANTRGVTEIVIQIDSCLVVELFLTQTHTSTVGVASGHLWYNSGTNFMGPISATPLEILPICQEDQDSNPPLDLRHWLSAHPYCLQCVHFHWATRLHGRNDLSDQLSARHAFNMTWGCIMNRSLINIDRDR